MSPCYAQFDLSWISFKLSMVKTPNIVNVGTDEKCQTNTN